MLNNFTVSYYKQLTFLWAKENSKQAFSEEHTNMFTNEHTVYYRHLDVLEQKCNGIAAALVKQTN